MKARIYAVDVEGIYPVHGAVLKIYEKYKGGWDVCEWKAEAGAFQYSYNSINAASELKDLFYNYRGKYPRVCSSKNWGDGIGFEFQKLSKENPEFSIKYAARLIRVLRKHFGPINRREVEYVPACREMLSKIKC